MYPRAWRERYGREVRELADELAATDGIPSWRRLTLGLLLSGLTERVRSWRLKHWIATVSTCVLVAVGLAALSSTTPQSTGSALRVHSKGVVDPEVIVYNIELAKGVKQPTASGPVCIVNLNPKTGAVIYAKSVRNHGAGCGALVLGNRPTVVPNS
jgi:hypothetical protein